MKIKIKPADGMIVRDPQTKQAIPAEGCEVDQSSYWLRRLKSGCVSLIVEKPKQVDLLPKKETQTKK